MGFKEDVQDDVQNVFFLEDEFVENHLIDGNEIGIIVDDYGLKKLNNVTRNSTAEKWKDEANAYSVLFYCKQEDIERKLTVGSELEYDDDLYFINSISKRNGVLKIVLGKNQV